MERNSYMTLIFIAHLALLVMFMAEPASVMSQTIHITTIEQLQKIGDNASTLDRDYALDADIDASATRSWNGGEGFEPIGTRILRFSGSFDGQGYAIKNLYINRVAANDVGLFGYVSGSGAPAAIRNVAIDNATIKGKGFTGALVGYKDNCLIYNCYSSGSVSAEADYAGGLLGWSQANTPITNCSSTCTVTGQLGIGGLVGYNNNCLINNCYSTGPVSANEYAGGLVGWSLAGTPISNCYSTSAVTGQNGIGGLVGYNDNTPIIKSYSAGKVSVTENRVGSLIGALIGWSTIATASDCFWDNNTSGQKISAGGTAKSTAYMKKRSTFVNAGWDFASVWGISDNKTYPFFRGSNDLPQAEPDSYSAGINNVLNIQPPGVLANDFDADGDPLTAILVTNPSHGSLSLKTDGSFTYTPDEDFSGTDSFTYKALAGVDYTASVSVMLDVTNTAPVAGDDNYTVNRNLRLSVRSQGVLDNDSDPNGDNLTAVLVVGPAHGTLELKESGSFTYKPEKGYFGTDNFTYAANDGALNSAPAVVTIHVKAFCPLVYLYGEDSSEVETLRRYRDEVLATSVSGRAGIHLYYRMAPLVEGVLKNSERMQRMAKTIINRSLPGIQERLPAGQ